MWKRSIFLCLVVAFAAVTSSCIFDPDEGDVPPPPTDDAYIFPAVNKSDVLHNLQLAYNERKIEPYDKNLDNGFTFFLSEGDVNGGLPVQWDRTEERKVNERLFSRTKDPNWPLCNDIEMDVQFEQTLQWLEVIPSSAPNETWYSTTVFYDFSIEVEPDTRFIPVSGAKAQFTVRNAGPEDAPDWKLVEWRDLGSGN